ncbi:MAG: hypothetical protein KDB10_20405, partial [Acidimicrobiales bacterium]|nr:hypothetical protein [Acidimicrobiales bacterium]
LPAVDLGTDLAIVAVAAGGFDSCALLADGSLRCWGVNSEGQLGLGRSAYPSNSIGDQAGEMGEALPAPSLGSGRSVLAMSVSDWGHTCAVLDNTFLKCWGRNFDGRLGLGDRVNRGYRAGQMGDALPPVVVVPVPSLDVALSAEHPFVFSGEDVRLRLVGTNTGNVPLGGLVITAPLGATCEDPPASLAPASVATLTCTRPTTHDDIGPLALDATVDSDQTDPVGSGPVDVTVAPDRRPDLTLKKAGGTRVGDDLHGTDPTDPDQTVTVQRARGGRVTFVARIRNDGDSAARYRFRRIGTDAGLSVRYVAGSTDVTAAVVRRTFLTAPVAPGASASIRVVVTLTSTASRQFDHTVTLRALSAAAHRQVDTVRAVVRVN